MKPARRTSSEVNRLQRNISHSERQPLLRTISNNQPNNNSTTFNSNSVNLSKSIENGLSSENKITSELIVPTIGRKGHLSESSDLCDNVTLPLNHSQKWILLCLCLVDFSAFASMSIIAPFFPYELYLRGQTTYVAGLVFSIYSLTVVISSVFFGPLSAHIGPKFMLLTGITVAGTANIIFGLLDYISNDTTFIALCFIIRIIEAVGAASFNTASLVYLFEIFPDHVGYAFSMTETFTTLGTTLGPAIGGLLYSWGGYGLPFYVLGTFAFITIPLCASKLPRISKARRNMTSSASYWQLLKIPKVAMICLIVLVLAQSLSFLDPTLEPFYRSMGLDVNYASLAFFIMSGTVCIFLPFFSKLVERVENEFLCMFLGLTINAVGLILLGPSDILNLSPSLGLSLTSLIVVALGYALAFIPTFENILSIAISRGMEDNLATYGTVSGLWSTMFALGEATGPILGGSLTDVVTFSMVSSFMALFSVVMAIVAGIAMTIRSNKKY